MILNKSAQQRQSRECLSYIILVMTDAAATMGRRLADDEEEVEYIDQMIFEAYVRSPHKLSQICALYN